MEGQGAEVEPESPENGRHRLGPAHESRVEIWGLGSNPVESLKLTLSSGESGDFAESGSEFAGTQARGIPFRTACGADGSPPCGRRLRKLTLPATNMEADLCRKTTFFLEKGLCALPRRLVGG